MKYNGFFNDKSVCVTGGAGFIGSHLSRRLVDEGAAVFILAEENSSLNLISDIISKVHIYRCAITDLKTLITFFKEKKPTVVYHLAAKVTVNQDIEMIDSLIDVNLHGTINVLKASAESGSVKKFICTGTSDVYGLEEKSYSENSVLNPITPYGASKAAAELFCKYMSYQCDIPYVILRPFIVYGGGQSPGMFIPQLIQAALKREDFPMTAGEQTRDFLYVDDFVEACINAVLCKEAEGETINIASGKEISLADVARNVMTLIDDSIKINFGALPYRDNERWHVRADIEKARRLLGWEPKIDLTEGLKKTIRWYDN